MNETHTPDSPLHPDAFAHMVGTERIDTQTGLRYRVESVSYKGERLGGRVRPCVTLIGRITESAPNPECPGATLYDSHAYEIFHTNPAPVEPVEEPAPVEPVDAPQDTPEHSGHVIPTNALHKAVGTRVTVVRDADPSAGVQDVSYTGTLVGATDARFRVLRDGVKTPRTFVRSPGFTVYVALRTDGLFDVADLTGMPEGPEPDRDLVSSWSATSMQNHLDALDRTEANRFVRAAVDCHATGRGEQEHHGSREGAVLSYLVAAENRASTSERGWYVARTDAYASLHGIRGWYRGTDSKGNAFVQVNRLRKASDGDADRYYVHHTSSTSWGPERLTPFWVVDRDTGRTAYRAPNKDLANQWITEHVNSA